MISMWAWLRSAVRSRYVVMLEQENARLRQENRAFLNSLLGVAGFAPVEVPDAAKPVDLTRFRKRSWHQLQAMKEREAARSDTRLHDG
jgi:hypothetical protein